MGYFNELLQNFLPKPAPQINDEPPPDGYLENENGHLVPLKNVQPMDLERDKLVMAAFERTQAMQAAMQQYKQDLYAMVREFLDHSAQQYEVEYAPKGNVTLYNFNKTVKVQISCATEVRFTEQLQSAQTLLEEWITEKSDGADEELVLIIRETFAADTEGRVSTSKLLQLLRYNIESPTWKTAMQAVRDSMMPVGKKEYIRVYERVINDDNQDGKWVMLNLSMGHM